MSDKESTVYIKFEIKRGTAIKLIDVLKDICAVLSVQRGSDYSGVSALLAIINLLEDSIEK